MLSWIPFPASCISLSTGYTYSSHPTCPSTPLLPVPLCSVPSQEVDMAFDWLHTMGGTALDLQEEGKWGWGIYPDDSFPLPEATAPGLWPLSHSLEPLSPLAPLRPGDVTRPRVLHCLNSPFKKLSLQSPVLSVPSGCFLLFGDTSLQQLPGKEYMEVIFSLILVLCYCFLAFIIAVENSEDILVINPLHVKFSYFLSRGSRNLFLTPALKFNSDVSWYGSFLFVALRTQFSPRACPLAIGDFVG